MLLNTKIAEKPSSPGATLLWTNPSPNSEFPASVIALDSGYTYYLVEFNRNKGNTNPILLLPYSETPVYYGPGVSTAQMLGEHAARLINYVRDGEISFGKGCYYDSGMYTYNSYFKPLRIWGVK